MPSHETDRPSWFPPPKQTGFAPPLAFLLPTGPLEPLLDAGDVLGLVGSDQPSLDLPLQLQHA